MLAYMEKKYKEPFTIVETYGGQVGKDYVMLKVRGKHADSALVRVMQEDGHAVYQDNYVGFLVRQEIQETLQPLAEEVFGTCKVFYMVPNLVLPRELRADADVTDFLRNPATMTRILIYPKKTVNDSLRRMEEFRKLLKENEYCFSGIISFPKEEAWYEMLCEENLGGENYLGYEAQEEISFKINNSGDFQYLKWIKLEDNIGKERRQCQNGYH